MDTKISVGRKRDKPQMTLALLLSLLSLLLPCAAVAQVPGLGPITIVPPPSVPVSGGTFTGPVTFNGTIGGTGPFNTAITVNNSTAGNTLGGEWQATNSGSANGLGFFWVWKTFSAGTGFDVGYELVSNVLSQSVGSGNPVYYNSFLWHLTPSDPTNNWGGGLGEWDLTTRLPTSIGWYRTRVGNAHNSGGFLEVPIATSSISLSGNNPFTTTLNSSTVSANIVAHMLQAGQYVTFSGGSPVAGLTISGSYQVVSVTDANDFTFSVSPSTANASTTGGGSVSVSEFNGTDELYGYSVSGSSDINTAKNRNVRTYNGFLVEPNTLVGVGNDTNSHGGDGFYGTGARVALGGNPITTNGTSTVSIAWTNSGLAVSGTFNISGATAINGYTPSGTYTVASVTTTTVTYTDVNASSSTGTGGGSSVIVYSTNDVPRAIFECDGAVASCLRTDAATVTGNAIQLGAGQSIGVTGNGGVNIVGTTTGNSAPAGDVGEYLTNGGSVAANTSVTITIAAPGVVTWTAHGFMCLQPIYFSTSGALPTGLSTFTNYYITCGTGLVTTNTFEVSTTLANALAGTAITTSGTQSGTQTGHTGVILGSGGAYDVMGIQLNAGDYDCSGLTTFQYGGSTSVTQMNTWMGTSGGSSQPTGSSILTSTASFNTLASAVVEPTTNLANAMPFRASLSSTGMAVLSVENTYTVSSMSAFSLIRCRRLR